MGDADTTIAVFSPIVGNAIQLRWKSLMRLAILNILIATMFAGCASTHQQSMGPDLGNNVVLSESSYPHGPMPRELDKVSLPMYTIAPPDILVINAINLVPKAPYQLMMGDVVAVTVVGTLPDAPIEAAYPIGIGGTIDFGIPYGKVRVVNKTVEEVEALVTEHLRTTLQDPRVTVSLLSTSAMQQITGEHLVGPDGTVNLGVYGTVRIVGSTIGEARFQIENHLSAYLEQPQVAVDVFAYNSKVYYIVTEGAGLGDGVFRFPVTGNETVLDAISNINGLNQVASKRIWIARPAPLGGDVQILPVDWTGITAQASTTTNYQLMPGDRLFIAEDKLVAWDNQMAKLFAPLERIMGFTLLGTNTATRLTGRVLQGGGNPRSSSGF